MKGLLTNNVSTDFVKDILDMANNVVEAIDKITSKLGTIGTLGAIGGISSFIKSMSQFTNFNGLTGFAKGITSIFNVLGSASGKGFTGGLTSIVTGFKSLVSGAGLAKTAMIAFNAVLNAIGWGLLIGGIALAIKAWDNYAHATEKAIEASKEREDGYRSEAQTLNSQITSLSGIAKEYDTLANKTNKTAEEMARYKELVNEIAEIAPELVTG